MANKQYDPLRILFCGADEFSIYSLHALRDLQQSRGDKVQSIGVVCRPDKRVGRGLKHIQEVPIKRVALDLGLNLHQIDTFKGWTPPSTINLIVAVSFGLLVPARLLEAAKYGGLNVHPSRLPDLRGPAPIQHTLLERRSHTGVTVQTMHPTKFDHGTILAQTPEPGLPIPNECTTGKLIEVLGPLGAEMLRSSIEDGSFVPPIHNLDSELRSITASHAPKIAPQDRKIDWSTWTADDLIVRDRVLGRLWDTTTYQRSVYGRDDTGSCKRVTFQGPWKNAPVPPRTLDNATDVGYPINGSFQTDRFEFLTADGYVISPTAATIEGERKDRGIATLQSGLRKRLQPSAHQR